MSESYNPWTGVDDVDTDFEYCPRGTRISKAEGYKGNGNSKGNSNSKGLASDAMHAKGQTRNEKQRQEQREPHSLEQRWTRPNAHRHRRHSDVDVEIDIDIDSEIDTASNHDTDSAEARYRRETASRHESSTTTTTQWQHAHRVGKTLTQRRSKSISNAESFLESGGRALSLPKGGVGMGPGAREREFDALFAELNERHGKKHPAPTHSSQAETRSVCLSVPARHHGRARCEQKTESARAGKEHNEDVRAEKTDSELIRELEYHLRQYHVTADLLESSRERQKQKQTQKRQAAVATDDESDSACACDDLHGACYHRSNESDSTDEPFGGEMQDGRGKQFKQTRKAAVAEPPRHTLRKMANTHRDYDPARDPDLCRYPSHVRLNRMHGDDVEARVCRKHVEHPRARGCRAEPRRKMDHKGGVKGWVGNFDV